MQSIGQALEVEVFDKDEGNDDDKLGRWVAVEAPRRLVADARVGANRYRLPTSEDFS